MIDAFNLAPIVIGRVRPGTIADLPHDVTIAAHYDRYLAAVIGLALSGLTDDYDQVVERIVQGCLQLGRAHIAGHADEDDEGPADATATYCGATYFAAWLAGTAAAAQAAEDDPTAGDPRLQELITPIVRWLGHLPGHSLTEAEPLAAGIALRRHVTTLEYTHTPVGQLLLGLAKVAMAGRETRMAAIGHLAFDVVATLGARGDDMSAVLATAAQAWRPSS